MRVRILNETEYYLFLKWPFKACRYHFTKRDSTDPCLPRPLFMNWCLKMSDYESEGNDQRNLGLCLYCKMELKMHIWDSLTGPSNTVVLKCTSKYVGLFINISVIPAYAKNIVEWMVFVKTHLKICSLLNMIWITIFVRFGQHCLGWRFFYNRYQRLLH